MRGGRWRFGLAAVAVASVAAFLAGCGTGGTGSAEPTPASTGKRAVSITVDTRPFLLHIPASYAKGNPVPLVVALHGYQWTGPQFAEYLGLGSESDRRGFLYVAPDGTQDEGGFEFWNATDACCDLNGARTDDSGYLSHLITAVRAQYPVNRVFLIGHSNGAFMSYRMACDHADQVTAIAALNGAMWNDPGRCRPTRPVSVLDIRSQADVTIKVGGGTGGPGGVIPYPSAAVTEADWLGFDRCSGAADRTAAPMDLVTETVGAETAVTTYPGCAGGSTVASWAIGAASHVPRLSDAFTPAVLDHLYAQPARP